MKKLFFILAAVLLICSLCLVSCGDTATGGNEVEQNTENSENAESGENTESSETEAASILENAALEEALKSLLGLDVLTENDLSRIYYLGITPSVEGKYNLCIGLADYLFAYYEEIAKDAPDPSALIPYAKNVDFTLEAGANLDNDLAKFTNVEIFELYTLPIADISFIKKYPNLVYGYFASNGIKDVSCLADYNPEVLLELDLSGNPIADWSPLKHIDTKVIVVYSFEDGTSLTLREFNSMTSSQFPSENIESGDNTPAEDTADAAEEGNVTPEAKSTEDISAEQTAEEIGKSLAEQFDIGSLFE